MSYLSEGGGGSGLVVWPVFKTAMEAPPAAPVGSIPTRSRHLYTPLRFSLIAVLLLLIGHAPIAAAQDSAAVQRRTATAVRADTLSRRYVSPYNALWRSLLIPGWGQAKLNRKLAGGMLVAWEASRWG